MHEGFISFAEYIIPRWGRLSKIVKTLEESVSADDTGKEFLEGLQEIAKLAAEMRDEYVRRIMENQEGGEEIDDREPA